MSDRMTRQVVKAHSFLAPLTEKRTPASVRLAQIEKFRSDCLARGLNENEIGEIFSAWYECYVSHPLQVYTLNAVDTNEK